MHNNRLVKAQYLPHVVYHNNNSIVNIDHFCLLCVSFLPHVCADFTTGC